MSKRPARRILKILLLLNFSSILLFADDNKNIPIEARAIWVTRWDFQTPEDIQKIIKNVAEYNFNIIFFQVRGTGTVYYKSQIEPWAWNNTFEYGAWDPLAYAIEQAHQAGLQLHAWVNVYPGWSSPTPPTNPDQLWNAHRDWFMVDMDGQPQRLNNHYVWLSPTHPEARQHLIDLFDELISNWKIDGIHFDYIRYPGSGYSYDSSSLTQFKLNYKDNPANLPEQWDQFRRDGITCLIDSVYAIACRKQPKLILSAAVVRNPYLGRKLYFQDAHHWIRQNIIDFISPMIYTSEMALFQNMLETHLQQAGNSPVFPGILVSDKHKTLNQIELCRQKGFLGHCLFSYKSLFPNHQPESLARLLKFSCYKKKAEIPIFKYKENTSKMSAVQEITTIPELIREGYQINISCLIPGLSRGQRVAVLWSNIGSLTGGKRIPLTRQNGTSDYFITPYGIPAQPVGTVLYYQILVDEENIASEIQSLVIHSGKPLFRQDTEFGPLIYDAQYIAVDAQYRAWVCERGKQQIRILNQDGNDAYFSPIDRGLNKDGQYESIANPCGITIDTYGIVYLSGNPAKHAIYRFDSNSGMPLNGLKLTFWPGDLDVDEYGHLYIHEAEGSSWHVFDDRGNELKNSPIFGSHISRGIAVSRDGTKVYVACQAEGTVHCWEGEIRNGTAHYQQGSDLLIKNVGMGTVDVDKQGNIYVSQVDAGSVTIFSPQHQFIDYLQGNHPPLRAPRGVALSTDGSSLYIVEWGIDSGVKMQRWIRNN